MPANKRYDFLTFFFGKTQAVGNSPGNSCAGYFVIVECYQSFFIFSDNLGFAGIMQKLTDFVKAKHTALMDGARKRAAAQTLSFAEALRR